MPNALLHGARSHPLLPLEPDEADRYDDDGDGNDYGIAVSPFQLRHVAKVHAVPARDERQRQEDGRHDREHRHDPVLSDI